MAFAAAGAVIAYPTLQHNPLQNIKNSKKFIYWIGYTACGGN
jgi:hypothetical protein